MLPGKDLITRMLEPTWLSNGAPERDSAAVPAVDTDPALVP
jgi:hypothetical protein